MGKVRVWYDIDDAHKHHMMVEMSQEEFKHTSSMHVSLSVIVLLATRLPHHIRHVASHDIGAFHGLSFLFSTL